MKKFVREHSLSIALGICFLLSTFGFWACEPGGHWYDFWNAMMGCFGGNFLFLLFARKFWEKGADPLLPPEECEDPPPPPRKDAP
jgi:hypothetical protein